MKPRFCGAEARPRLRAEAADLAPSKSSCPLLGVVERADQVEQRALAAARGADDRDQLSRPDLAARSPCSTSTSLAAHRVGLVDRRAARASAGQDSESQIHIAVTSRSLNLTEVDSLSWEGDVPQLRTPILVCSFRGWNDAAAAASTALTAVEDAFDAELIARGRRRGLLRLPGDPADDRPQRGPGAPHRLAAEQPDRRPRARPPTATWSCSTAPSPTCAGAPSRRRSPPPPTRSGSRW